MLVWYRKGSLALGALVFVWIVTGFDMNGRSVWIKDPNLSPVNETQMFLYDTFPPEFLWGVGTSAFQVEGSQWKDGKGPSIWEYFIQSPLRAGSMTDDDSSDSYTFLEKDLSALDFLGVSSYQFSISWPRLFPTGVVTAVNEKGLHYYNRLLNSLLHRRIEPVVTLYHWDLPLTLQEEYGGWKNESLVDIFSDFAMFCFKAFGDRVKYWITVHNPYLVAWQGYGTGIHAPGERQEGAAVYTVGHNLIKDLNCLHQIKGKGETEAKAVG
ncbi:beta-klotho-like isoform X2 [Eublepharis macularius]|uniref:Beta-klotho-like isoform X2 n=1 Tax=Eublepharis macularius TaxID=481883 RepID=A0AA97LBH6_EUBMA|nr:beta-klotho-like isoform X2 [Eublepharis macularius]